MYSVLPDKGSIYIRDLKRDADWQIVLERIDDERWKRPELVRDYIGAMAGMLTINELDILLSGLGINNFEIRSGEYLVGGFLGYERDENTINEYECEVEYVCVIRKNKNI